MRTVVVAAAAAAVLVVLMLMSHTHTHTVSSHGTPRSAPLWDLRDPVVDGVDLSENLNLQLRICAGKFMMKTVNKTTLDDFCTTSCVAQMSDWIWSILHDHLAQPSANSKTDDGRSFFTWVHVIDIFANTRVHVWKGGSLPGQWWVVYWPVRICLDKTWPEYIDCLLLFCFVKRIISLKNTHYV